MLCTSYTDGWLVPFLSLYSSVIWIAFRSESQLMFAILPIDPRSAFYTRCRQAFSQPESNFCSADLDHECPFTDRSCITDQCRVARFGLERFLRSISLITSILQCLHFMMLRSGTSFVLTSISSRVHHNTQCIQYSQNMMSSISSLSSRAYRQYNVFNSQGMYISSARDFVLLCFLPVPTTHLYTLKHHESFNTSTTCNNTSRSCAGRNDHHIHRSLSIHTH